MDTYTIIYTASNSAIAAMLVDKLKKAGIPAMLGKDSTAAGVLGIPYASRTILVPKGKIKKALSLIQTRINET